MPCIGKNSVRQREKILKTDMSERCEKHDATKLTGCCTGIYRLQKRGLLMDFVKQNPHAVLCVDEIEKAPRYFQHVSANYGRRNFNV
jgi:ATP-dependent Clp protease ATP-binding subunit ClpA